MVPYMVSRAPEDMYRMMCEQQVTVLDQTPSAFQQLVHVEERMALGKGDVMVRPDELALRVVIFAGEALMTIIGGEVAFDGREEDKVELTMAGGAGQ